jgi:hypothetical protein
MWYIFIPIRAWFRILTGRAGPVDWFFGLIGMFSLVVLGVALLVGYADEHLANAYLDKTEATVSAVADARDELFSLMDDAGDNPDLLYERSWKRGMQSAADEMWDGYDELRAITPPNRFRELHEEIIEWARSFANCADEIVAFSRSDDFDRLDKAVEWCEAGDAAMERAREAGLGE